MSNESGAQAVMHVGLLTHDLEASAQTWVRLFHGRRTGPRPGWFAAEEGLLSTHVLFPGGSVEPLEPIRTGTMQSGYRERKKFAFHIGIKVASMDDAIEHVRRHGVWAQVRPKGEIVQVQRGWLDESCTSGIPIEFLDAAELAEFRDPHVASADPSQQPFTLDAVGHVVRDLERAVAFYVEVLGFELVDSAPRKRAFDGIATQRIQLPEGLSLEIAAPTRPDSVVSQQLTSTGEGIGYVTMVTDSTSTAWNDLSAAEAWLRRSDGQTDFWVHGRSTGGLPVLVSGRT